MTGGNKIPKKAKKMAEKNFFISNCLFFHSDIFREKNTLRKYSFLNSMI